MFTINAVVDNSIVLYHIDSYLSIIFETKIVITLNLLIILVFYLNLF